MSKALDHLAARVATDPLFLAGALAEFARSEGLDDAALATALGCTTAVLTRLRLCRAPRPDPDGFRHDVAAVASHFQINPTTLAEAVRRGQSLARLRMGPSPAADPGLLLAARDHKPLKTEQEPPP